MFSQAYSLSAFRKESKLTYTKNEKGDKINYDVETEMTHHPPQQNKNKTVTV